MNDAEKQAVADLVMRALDTIERDYGDDTRLVSAVLVYEVRTPDGEGYADVQVNYEGLQGMSPYHAAGLLDATATYIKRPDDG